MGKKKRSWASLLLAGLVLLTVRPAAAAEASRQESIRILFEELVEQEKNGTSMSAEEAAAPEPVYGSGLRPCFRG